MKQRITPKRSGTEEVLDLTPDELRELDEYQDMSDEQLTGIIQSIKTFTEVVFAVWAKEKNNKQQKSIPLPIPNDQNIAA